MYSARTMARAGKLPPTLAGPLMPGISISQAPDRRPGKANSM